MRKRILYLVFVFVFVSIGIGYFINNLTNNKVKTVYLNEEEQRELKDNMVWNKEGEVVNKERFNDLLNQVDSVRKVESILNNNTFYRYDKDAYGNYTKEAVFQREFVNERFKLYYSNDTIAKEDSLTAFVTIFSNDTGTNYVKFQNSPKYKMKERKGDDKIVYEYNFNREAPGRYTLSGDIFIGERVFPFSFNYIIN
jgi:hypothetical protein